MRKINYLIILLIATILLGACTEKDPDAGKEVLTSINTSINAIVVDQDNTKWIGTKEGLYKSVEGGFVTMELTNAGEIYSLGYDEKNDLLWIGTEQGLLHAEIDKGAIVETKIANENLSNFKVVSYNKDKESRNWFGTEEGITMNNNDFWKQGDFRVNTEGREFPMTVENFTVNSIAIWDGDYFFATSGAKLYRAYGYDAEVDAFTSATQWDYPYNGQAISDSMFVVFIDNEGNQWMGGKDGIQVHSGHDPKAMSDFTYYFDELPDYYVLCINQAPNGDIWVGTRKGLARFDGESWETITDVLPDLNITAIQFDEDGSAWIGTRGGLVNID